jgi:hypothetical protein
MNHQFSFGFPYLRGLGALRGEAVGGHLGELGVQLVLERVALRERALQQVGAGLATEAPGIESSDEGRWGRRTKARARGEIIGGEENTLKRFSTRSSQGIASGLASIKHAVKTKTAEHQRREK